MKISIAIAVLVAVAGWAGYAAGQYPCGNDYSMTEPDYSSPSYKRTTRGDTTCMSGRRRLLLQAREDRRAAHAEDAAKLAEWRKKCAKPVPACLAIDQLSDDGTIEWPALLLDHRYDRVRARLNTLFAVRAVGTSKKLDSNLRREMDCDIKEMSEILDNHAVTLVDANDWMAARRFVQGLRNEAATIPGSTTLAASK